MKNLHRFMYIALFFFGFILITGCSEMEAPTAANAGQQSLLKSSDDDDDELVIDVAVDGGSFQAPAGIPGPFNIQGNTGSGSGTFQCWGWSFGDGTNNVSQVYEIDGRGAIMTQGREGTGAPFAVVGGTGDFSEAKGEALTAPSGTGFTITFFLDD